MNVYWLEQAEADVPLEDRWLSAREMLSLSGLRFAKRRADWRLGRWTAKRAIADCLGLPADLSALADTEIRTAPSGAPQVFFAGQTQPVTISISHRAGTALCTVALSRDSLGCDLEMIERRSDAFTADYFTINERALVESTLVEHQPLLVTLLWSAKESALKALGTGLRLDTNCLEVSFIETLLPHSQQHRQDLHLVPMLSVDTDQWRPLRLRYCKTQVFGGWWRYTDGMVRTVVSAFSFSSPIHSVSLSRENYSLSPEGANTTRDLLASTPAIP
jgi:4'-phosphopantetheinyl transferase